MDGNCNDLAAGSVLLSMRHGIAWSRRYLADLAALLVVTIWGVNFAFMKAALEQFDVWAFTGLRLLGMLVLGWGVLVWRSHRATRGRTTATGFGLRRADLPLTALTGALGY